MSDHWQRDGRFLWTRTVASRPFVSILKHNMTISEANDGCEWLHITVSPWLKAAVRVIGLPGRTLSDHRLLNPSAPSAGGGWGGATITDLHPYTGEAVTAFEPLR